MAAAFSTRSRLPRESIPIPNPHPSTVSLGQTAQCLSLCSRRSSRRIACDEAICPAQGDFDFGEDLRHYFQRFAVLCWFLEISFCLVRFSWNLQTRIVDLQLDQELISEVESQKILSAMAGSEDKVGVINDWSFPNLSPRTLMSSFLSEDFGSRPFPESFQGKENEELHRALEMDQGDRITKVEEDEPSNRLSFEPNWSGTHKPNMHGNLAERMAANGFNVPKLNTARIPPANLSSPSDIQSPYLTIPPGLSPTSLLDSPVFLSNAMAQLSPTTGKLQFLQDNSAQPTPLRSDDALEGASGFSFKPPFNTYSSFYPSSEIVASDVSQQQTIPNVGLCVELGKAKDLATLETGTMNFQNEEFSFQAENKHAASANTSNQRSDSCMGSTHSGPFDEQQDGDMDLKEEFSSVAVPVPAEDGYNWRKYGQKQVKGSEFPRSYYKCTHPNCQVKKKVERSQEGQITEIIYKGTHDHPKPPPTRRTGLLSSHPFTDTQMDVSEQPDFQGGSDSKPIWANTNIRSEAHDWPGDSLEVASSARVLAECGESSTSVQHGPDGPHLSSDVVDVSSTMSNDKDEGDQVTHGSVSLCCDGEGDETDSKRMKLDTNAIELNAASRAVREPRVVVQTTSEVDILDDGYRWRKYGQKVVKGNPNPRSYYKCTHPGCNVRKHVERAAHDLKSVITTYEGKHNHEVPAARNSGHANSATSIAASNTAPQSHGLLPRADSAQGGLVRYECPPLNAAFALPGAQHLQPATSYTFGMAQSGLPNLAMAGLGPLHTMSLPVLPSVHSYLGHHPAHEGGFAKAKAEPKDESIPGSTPNGSLIYQTMNEMPVRPPM
ncbi:hypothetical protein ZIOFF_007984 [Zingiber officinale]|uniref:WRKY domain-containing protein n=2 Tax=Zingiber officinale TaxID=94328 RepID=A0A8J5LQH2_ZINOF|nr:hypothetical protein ZIOFF_007984 [Zingiber officinale]